MNPQSNPTNTMSPELQQAIAARAQTGVGTPQLAQTQQGAPAPMPQMPAQPATGQPDASQAGISAPKSTSEEELITKALIARQKQLGEFKKNEQQPTLQQMPVS